jgi:hypothetical protein
MHLLAWDSADRPRCSPEKEKYFLFIYEVITWGKRKKSSAIQ